MATTAKTPPPETLMAIARQRVAHHLNREDWLMRLLIGLAGLWLILFVLLPLYQIVARSSQDRAGNFVGLDNYVEYFSSPALSSSFYNSLYMGSMSMIITVTLAFIFAYGLTRTQMPGKRLFSILAMLPIYAPSLIHAIAFIYLFGNQGIITTGFFGFFHNRFGLDLSYNINLYSKPTGIILAEVFYLFPHALMILIVALTLADSRLYEASLALKGSSWRTFLTVTLPGAKYGLISAAFVCFTLAFTDFGIPKVIGGSFNVMATDIYKRVIGQQDFVRGATVSVLMLAPTVIAFVIDRIVQQRQVAMMSMRAVPFQPRRMPLIDWLMFAYCTLVTLIILAVLGTALFASLINVWPYDFSFSLRHYDFRLVAGGTARGGLAAYWNSVRMATYTAVFGTIIVFSSAYLIEKGKGLGRARATLYFLSTLPVALPGLVIGLAYIFFFNKPAWQIPFLNVALPNPVMGLYGTMAILVLSTIVHFYTVSFFTAMTALKQIDAEFEAVSASLAVPFYKTFWRVTVPIALPAILEVGMYFFVNAMTTVSAVIFLYSANLRLASVAVVNMDDAGDTAPAAAMSMLIFFTGIGVRILYGIMTRGIQKRTQAWRMR